MKIIKIILYFSLLFLLVNINAQENMPLIEKVNVLNRIAGSSVGRNDLVSEEYKIFELITQLDTYNVVKIFQETKNPIGKVFCYWALKERKYKNYAIYHEYLKSTYSTVQIKTQWYGEFTENEPLIKIIDYNYRKLWLGKK